jgi:WD40 repeat protein
MIRCPLWIVLLLICRPEFVLGEQSKQEDTAPIAKVDALGDLLPRGARLRFGTTRFRAPALVCDLALSPDEKVIVSIGDELIVWDAQTGKVLWRAWARDHGFNWSAAYGVRGIAFSSDSAHFYTANKKGDINCWDVKRGECSVVSVKAADHATLEAVRPYQCKSIDVTRDGRRFAIGGPGGVTVCRQDGEFLYHVANQSSNEIDLNTGDRLLFDGDGCLAIFAPYGGLLAVATSDTPNTIRLLESATGKEIQRCELRSRLVRMAFSPDNKQLAATERDSSVRMYSVTSGLELWSRTIRLTDPDENYTSAVAYSPDGKTVAVCATDYSIYLFNAATGDNTGKLEGSHWYPWALAFTADSQTLFSSGWDSVIRRWDVASGKQIELEKGFHATGATAIAPNGQWITCEKDTGAIGLFDAESGVEVRTIPATDIGHSQLAFSSDSKFLAGGGSSEEQVHVNIWNVDSGERLHHWDWSKGNDPHSTVEGLSFSPNGKHLAASVFRQGKAGIWDLSTGKQTALLKHPSVYGLSFSPDSKTLATAGWDSMVRFWDVDTGLSSESLNVRADRPNGEDLRMYTVCYSPTGSLLATAQLDGHVRIWKAETQELIQSLVGNGRFAYGAMSFSPDGKLLATGQSNGQVVLWDPITGHKVADIGQHQHHVYTVCFGRDNRQLLSGGGDGCCYLWDVPPIPPASETQNETTFCRETPE